MTNNNYPAPGEQGFFLGPMRLLPLEIREILWYYLPLKDRGKLPVRLKMKKSKVNFVIDVLLTAALASITGIGLLIKFVLVPGFKRWEIYGRNVELYFWGWDRHEWGYLHFLTGCAFAVLLVLHVVLHWSLIVSIYRSMVPRPWLRRALAVVFAFLLIWLFAFAAMVRPEVSEKGGHGLAGGWSCGGEKGFPCCPAPDGRKAENAGFLVEDGKPLP
jgi:hypothetical protein